MAVLACCCQHSCLNCLTLFSRQDTHDRAKTVQDDHSLTCVPACPWTLSKTRMCIKAMCKPEQHNCQLATKINMKIYYYFQPYKYLYRIRKTILFVIIIKNYNK